MNSKKLCWLDVRDSGEARAAIVTEAVHHRIDGVASDDPADLTGLPPTVRKVLLVSGAQVPEGAETADVLVLPTDFADRDAVAAAYPHAELGRYVEIVDADSLELACEAARTEQWSLLNFRDPTKIPLEIVIAAAAGAKGSIVVVVADAEEAEIVFGVLELGSEGVMMSGRAVGDAAGLARASLGDTDETSLVELTIVATHHIGMGDRACVDTCSYLRPDEGILVGSTSKGMILCVSETHPLPYMQTRPFRVNAGAIHSYTIAADGRTNYLSELHAGSKVMAVDVKGRSRLVAVGRVKIESRPLISIDAVHENGQTVNLILQDDWHVRVLGPDGVVLNSTELKPGDVVLGHLPTADRHVGYPIDEFCLEQ